MTLTQAAIALNRSPGWLSLVERGSTGASADDLACIAQLFDMERSCFLESSYNGEEERGLILRAHDRERASSTGLGTVDECLTPKGNSSFLMVKTTYEARASGQCESMLTYSEESGVLVEGSLILRVGDREFQVEAGDSFHVSGETYSWRNDRDHSAVAIRTMICRAA